MTTASVNNRYNFLSMVVRGYIDIFAGSLELGKIWETLDYPVANITEM